ncbi:MAG: hypothetical protein LBH66_07485 [Oscillospiraceae bacterium]|nr:hypothetical protein [Oscillospiraceae bacterium]
MKSTCSNISVGSGVYGTGDGETVGAEASVGIGAGAGDGVRAGTGVEVRTGAGEGVRVGTGVGETGGNGESVGRTGAVADGLGPGEGSPPIQSLTGKGQLNNKPVVNSATITAASIIISRR